MRKDGKSAEAQVQAISYIIGTGVQRMAAFHNGSKAWVTVQRTSP